MSRSEARLSPGLTGRLSSIWSSGGDSCVPTKISAPPAETQENSFAWTLPGRVRPALCFSKNVLLVTKRKRGDFHTPVHQGQLVELVRGVIAVGKTSMTVKAE